MVSYPNLQVGHIKKLEITFLMQETDFFNGKYFFIYKITHFLIKVIESEESCKKIEADKSRLIFNKVILND